MITLEKGHRSMSGEKYIGLDVRRATISVAVRDSQGNIIMESILEIKAATILDFCRTPRDVVGHLSRRGPQPLGSTSCSSRMWPKCWSVTLIDPMMIGIELGRVGFRQRVTTLVLSVARWVHNSAMA